MAKIAVFPGTFDPITYGHQNLIERSAKVFDQLIVAVAENKNKDPMFNLQQRLIMIKKTLIHIINIKIKGFNNLLINFAKENKASIIIRGIRVIKDFEYEMQLANINNNLDPDIETIFLTPTEKKIYISSSLVKEITRLGGNISKFVDPYVAHALKRKILNK